jgi:hypothetical protein
VSNEESHNVIQRSPLHVSAFVAALALFPGHDLAEDHDSAATKTG